MVATGPVDARPEGRAAAEVEKTESAQLQEIADAKAAGSSAKSRPFTRCSTAPTSSWPPRLLSRTVRNGPPRYVAGVRSPHRRGWRSLHRLAQDLPALVEELADVFFYFAASTEMNGIDLQEELNASSPRTRPVSTNVTLAESPSASKMRHSRTQRSNNVVLRRPHSSLHSAALMDLRTCLWLPRSQRTCHVRFAGGVQRCHQS